MEFLFSKKDYHNYTEDSFLGTKNIWYWQWEDEKIRNLYSKCSVCGEKLVYDENLNNDTVFYYCSNCKTNDMVIKGGNYKYAQFLIEREIRKKIKK